VLCEFNQRLRAMFRFMRWTANMGDFPTAQFTTGRTPLATFLIAYCEVPFTTTTYSSQ
jgi:hypothetical protein